MMTKLNSAKAYAKNHPDYEPFRSVHGLLPDVSAANPDARQQYINGHFCYALKAGIITNGLGILRHIALFDDSFKKSHPDVISPKPEHPEKDKEIGDSIALKPVLSDFFNAHPHMHFSTFTGDSAFDSYNNYSLLKDDFHFARICIPLNQRNSKTSDACFDASGHLSVLRMAHPLLILVNRAASIVPCVSNGFATDPSLKGIRVHSRAAMYGFQIW